MTAKEDYCRTHILPWCLESCYPMVFCTCRNVGKYPQNLKTKYCKANKRKTFNNDKDFPSIIGVINFVDFCS